MAEAIRDQNHITVALGVSSASPTTTLPFKIDSSTGRLLTDSAAGAGTVTSVSVETANGFSGTVANPTTTPAISIETTVSGLLLGDGTGVSAAPTTGTGDVVLANSPVLVTPDLGTPSAVNLANATNLPASAIAAGTAGISITGNAATVTAANEAADTTCFVLFATSATGPIGPKSNASLTFNSSSGILGTASLVASVGLCVGFSGTPESESIQIGDANFELNYLGGSIPTLFFDASDGLSYARSTNEYDFLVSSDPVFTIAATNIRPGTNGSSTLGTSLEGWGGTYLSSGGFVNFGNGNAVLTHSSGLITSSVPFSVGTSNAITAGTIELGAASDTTLSRSSAGVLAVEGVVIPSVSSTNTLTNKRVTPRVTAISANSATPTINTDNCEFVDLTAQTNNITSMTTNLSGTPTNGQKLWIAMTAGSGTPTVAWGASFEDSTFTAPTSLSTTRQDVGFVWNSTTSKWRCVAKA